MMGETKKNAGICLFTILVVLLGTGGQALIGHPAPTPLAPIGHRAGSMEVWEDEFFTTEKIDPAFSQHIVVNTTSGTVALQGTYPAWTNPSFPRMKPITLTNSGTEAFEHYLVHLTIAYESEMQVDFDDLRFADPAGVLLPYYLMKKTNGVSATVLVDVPLVPVGSSVVYLFYGNPTVSSQSSFSSIFSWRERLHPDTMVSFKAAAEGAWDPDVEYGEGRFLVAWEERLGPEDIPVPLPHYERTIPGVIHGRSYNKDNGNPIPQNNSDIDISDPALATTFHAENPTVAFGAGNFFVVWEENPANQPLQRYEADVKGAIVTPDGQVDLRFTVCSYAGGQFNPQVAYDSMSDRFLVVWADARFGGSSYDVRGRLYTSSGFAIGAEFLIAYEVNYQGNPWVSGDGVGNFIIVYEDGPDAAIGPFSLYAYRYTWEGVRIGSRITIATGTDTLDHIFPAVSYNVNTEEFLVTWNDGDVSVDPNSLSSYDGNIWGKILSRVGVVLKDNYIIEAGTSYIRSVPVPFFESMFFVAYNGMISGVRDIYGRVISSDGTLMTTRKELTDGSSLNVDWCDLAAGEGRLYATWEDERDVLSDYADVFSYVWRPVQTIGSLNVSSTLGAEVELITTGQLMSVIIAPEEFREWRTCGMQTLLPPTTSISVDIMDDTGTVLLKADVQDGENISDVNVSAVRLRATFSRVAANVSPLLDLWNISAFVGKDIYPPVTTISLDPEEPNGNNSWYISPITVTFNVTDVDSDPENITTYYNINGFGTQVYDPQDPPVISSERPNNYIEFWSNDSVNEELPHHLLQGLKIDMTPPMITLYEPPYIISPGETTVNGSVTDFLSGSGIARVVITVNEETIYDEQYSGQSTVWFSWSFIADLGESYEIYVEAWDTAGSKIEDRRTVVCPDYGMYEPGYIYLFNTQKLGPLKILVTLGLSIAVNYDTLYVVLPDVTSAAASVKFTATQVFLKNEYVFWDENLTDGCSVDLLVPFGFYEIKASAYDEYGTLLQEYPIITKMLILLL
ncbi:MAG: DUF2341 domain-containing protein [Candidatus Thermoplasmatota archaeon]|nr:DUF2341 domain-containing protein [Candidatus Thermoplasmatota archaeon]